MGSIRPVGVVATACRHSGSGATREAPAVIVSRDQLATRESQAGAVWGGGEARGTVNPHVLSCVLRPSLTEAPSLRRSYPVSSDKKTASKPGGLEQPSVTRFKLEAEHDTGCDSDVVVTRGEV